MKSSIQAGRSKSLLRSLFRRENTRRYELLILILTVGIGFLLRLYFSLKLPFEWDSGIFLYWANLINNGSIPYRDFFIRDPVYIYLVAFFMRILGPGYPAIALASIIPSVATIPIIYLIVREITDHASGLVAAITYSVAPTVVWYGTVFDERSLMLFLMACALFTLVKGLKTGRVRFLVYYGFILGIGTFAYRGIAIYILTVPFLFAYLNMTKSISHAARLKRFLSDSAISVTSYVISAGSLLAAFAVSTNFNWMVSSFGFSGEPESAGWFIWGQTTTLSFKDRIFDVAVREWLYLIVPAGLFLLTVVMARLSRWRSLAVGVAVSIAALFLLGSVLRIGSFPQMSYGAYEPNSEYERAFLLFLVLGAAFSAGLFPAVASRISQIRKLGYGYSIVIFWFISTATLVMLFGVPLVNYYYYFAPSLTIMASVVVRAILGLSRPSRPHLLSSVVNKSKGIILLGILFANAAVISEMLLSSEMTWRDQSSSTISKIASYIESRTSPRDEVLAGDAAIALFAHRNEILGITMWQMYGRLGPEPFEPLPDDPFHLFPNVAEISKEMSSGNVKYVVADQSPSVPYIIGLHPMWEQSFKSNFVLETTIDGILIYSFSPSQS